LVNHDLQEEVFVMLVKTPNVVLNTAKEVPTSKQICANAEGKEVARYFDYKKNLTLSDGIFWEIESEVSDPEFAMGTPAYVGYNKFYDSENAVLFFIIGGKEREAIYRSARPGNFFYHW
jgi:hypothetical protein